jgi:Putative bacterial sensory transduction regulator
MEYAHESHRTTHEMVSAYMTQLYGESAHQDPDSGSFSVVVGSAITQVVVLPRSDHSVVTVLSWVVTGVEPSFDLYSFLLNENYDMVYGAFSVDKDNDIAFRVTLYGDTLDKEELNWAVMSVAGIADEFDDRIVNRFGGKRASDRV